MSYDASDDTLGFITQEAFYHACQQLVSRWRSLATSDLHIKCRQGEVTGQCHFLYFSYSTLACPYILYEKASVEKWKVTPVPVQKDEAYLAISHPLRNLQTTSPRTNADEEATIDELEGAEEDNDEAAIYHANATATATAPPAAEYHIIYSPSYRVPVLYFFLHNLPPSSFPSSSSHSKRRGSSVTGIEAVYQYLVPSHQREAIQQIGVLGGIGMVVCLPPAFPPFVPFPVQSVSQSVIR